MRKLDMYDKRPRTRGDCKDGPRPCPYVSCRHHLYLEVSERGTIWVNDKTTDVCDMKETCSLDIADREDVLIRDSDADLHISKETGRTAINSALKKLAAYLDSDQALPSHPFKGGPCYKMP